jgi:putative molybdopterin biosynthesis protein
MADLVGDPLPALEPRRVRLTYVGGRMLARSLTGATGILRLLPWADGLGLSASEDSGQVQVELLGEVPGAERALVMLGCDPSAALLALVLQGRAVELIWSEEGSLAALEGLARGEAHVAGCHLLDPQTGVYNFPWVTRLVPFPCTVVSFAVWEQGLILASGNPRHISGVGDLAQPEVHLVNRAIGTGARMLLDEELRRAGVPTEGLRGYDRCVPGHLAVADAVRSGLADAGIGIRAAAVAAGLDFIPMGEERYDLVIPNHFLDLLGVTVLLDQLRRPGLREQVETLGGYDVATMGETTSIAANPTNSQM